MNNIVYYKNEVMTNNKLGIKENKIFKITDFISNEESKNLIKYIDSISEELSHLAGFYGTSGIIPKEEDDRLNNFNLPSNYFNLLKNKFKEKLEESFNIKVKLSICYVQVWEEGSFSGPHSDNSDFNGEPNNLRTNKFATIIYLNDDYKGGELYFPKHGIEISPEATSFICFPGGAENIHGVKEILKNKRYSFAAFWDFADAEYDESFYSSLKEELNSFIEKGKLEKKYWADQKLQAPDWLDERVWRLFVIKRTHLNLTNPVFINKNICYYPEIMGGSDDIFYKINYSNLNNFEYQAVTDWIKNEIDNSLLVKHINESKYGTTTTKNKSIVDKIKATIEKCVEEYLSKLENKEYVINNISIYKHTSNNPVLLKEEKKSQDTIKCVMFLGDCDNLGSVEFIKNGEILNPKPGSVIIFPSSEDIKISPENIDSHVYCVSIIRIKKSNIHIQ